VRQLPGEPYFRGEKSLKYGSFRWLLRWRPYWSLDPALAPLPYHAIHHTILPASHHFTRLVFSAEHTRFHHAGPQLLKHYYMSNTGSLNKKLDEGNHHQCLTCYKFKAQSTQQLMGELPSARVQPSKLFLTTGVDYARPISLTLGTTCSKTITKGYIAIFVCFATRAVHIEVVTSQTTEAFLAALRRSIARRGKPRTFYSDNGTNFMKSTTCFNPHQRWQEYRSS